MARKGQAFRRLTAAALVLLLVLLLAPLSPAQDRESVDDVPAMSQEERLEQEYRHNLQQGLKTITYAVRFEGVSRDSEAHARNLELLRAYDLQVEYRLGELTVGQGIPAGAGEDSALVADGVDHYNSHLGGKLPDGDPVSADGMAVALIRIDIPRGTSGETIDTLLNSLTGVAEVTWYDIADTLTEQQLEVLLGEMASPPTEPLPLCGV